MTFLLGVLLLCTVGALSAPQPVLFGKLPHSPKTSSQHFGIVGGQNASISKFPYLASLQNKGSQYGAAVILNSNWLLTTGWAVFKTEPSDLTFRVGSDFYDKQGQVLKASKIIQHPKYTAKDFDYDIAVVKVSQPIKFSKNVKAIGGLATKRLKPGTKGWIAGWGVNGEQVLPEHLLAAQATTYSKKNCVKEYHQLVTPRIFCTYDQEVAGCYNDYGDPLVVDNVVYGLFAGGYVCSTYDANMYTDVSALHQWVQDTIKTE